jgi:hypothetical protein
MYATNLPTLDVHKRRVLFAQPLVTVVHERGTATPARLCLESVAVAACGTRSGKAMVVKLAVCGDVLERGLL